MIPTEHDNTPNTDRQDHLIRLPAGSTIQRGDKFLVRNGDYIDMDNRGRLFGVQCIGQTVSKEGSWFREPSSFTHHPPAEQPSSPIPGQKRHEYN